MKFKYFKKELVNSLPTSPGIYVFKGKGGLLYIGKASNLKARVKNHFQAPSSRDHLFMDQVKTIGIAETPSDIEALLLESQLIKKHQPKYNVMWKDDKRYFYVAVTKEKLPRIFITHQPFQKKNSLAIYIGPFVDGKPLKQTLRILRPIFPYYTQRTHPRVLCGYCHLELCPGPNPDKKAYAKNVKRLIAILEGKKSSLLKSLEKEMQVLSRNERYEKAALLRDKIQALQTVFRTAHAAHRYVPLKGKFDWKSAEAWLRRAVDFPKPISRMEAYDISNIQGKEATGSMVVFVEGKPAKQFYRKFKIHIAGKPNDFAMMKELLSRRISHEEWGFPQVMLIDGGKGQLSSALAALGTRNMPPLRVVALAKKNNELFMEGKREPLLLSDMPRPLAHVLLHIRDEAHRFAITYHRKLRRVDITS
ncbi:MAG: GIY-YIG nuclease family protein [bacterium]|nr:GIY-YIG nuclease family protein [bacterium]